LHPAPSQAHPGEQVGGLVLSSTVLQAIAWSTITPRSCRHSVPFQ
jgi:hypothetical protein